MRYSTIASVGLGALASVASAATVSYNWTIDWVRAAPDGFARPVVGVNGKWPCPPIRATVGDTVVVTIKNNLGNQTTGLHFHGINQINTIAMDGAAGVTQCPLPPGEETLTYTFIADEPGTYWYHSHTMGQYPDGLRGPLIVDDPKDPFKGKYDEEVIMSVSDWYHTESLYLVRAMLTPANDKFLPPFPDSIIINEGGDSHFQYVKGKTYRFRIINYSAFASAMLQFDSHPMTVIMNDASYVKPAPANQIRISPAQRYDVLITCTNADFRNYPILWNLDQNRDYQVNPAWTKNFTAQLVVSPTLPMTDLVVYRWEPLDDSLLLPYDNMPILPPPNKVITLDFSFCKDAHGIPRACFNNQTYVPQKVPTLYTAATVGKLNENPEVYGDVIPFVVNYGDVVEIIVNNLDAAIHPFHLHGHHFQVLSRPHSNAGIWSARADNYNQLPPRREVVHVNAMSYAVLRFKATNPGVFLFHCHIEWHVEMGLTATIIEAPEKLVGLMFPADHLAACARLGVPVAGNAAGNFLNPLDTTGMKTEPDVEYYGSMYYPLGLPSGSNDSSPAIPAAPAPAPATPASNGTTESETDSDDNSSYGRRSIRHLRVKA